MAYSKRCWVLLITRDMRVHVPPELYLSVDQAEDEARRWLATLFGWRPTSKRVSSAGAVSIGRRFALHLIDFELHESWHAGSLWIGAEWNDRSFRGCEPNSYRQMLKERTLGLPIASREEWGSQCGPLRGTVAAL